ncbi:uncharacterized protein N7477_003916 [Penicillium maclennaniae]|uniref:uncharacterized protein n=1 Tax=Penicillium maclennaniae TaxID=1343394 RepID=UPI002542243D|nr:uncharacterized protein N7477_003916 [Penicillium maclennaniae]KAJ5678283.1 hypothetical protein N7477_003916 [Penicillium maclennaniae]
MDSSNIEQRNNSTSEASVSTADENSTNLFADQPAESLESQQKAKARAEKAEAIRRACDAHDIETLISSAITEGGLLDDALRQRAWPILLHCDESTILDDSKPLKEQSRHVDEDQVQLDVDRSFVYYPNVPAEELSEKKKQLSALITQILRNHPMLCYFQGYHDIVQVLLLVLGKHRALPAMTQLSLFRIRDYMLPSLSPAVKHLQLIPAIIETVDPVLRRHLSTIQPFFALAATLTLYAHDIQEYSDIARLFDYLLAREPVVAIYLFAAIILSRKEELLDIPLDEPEMLHFKLSKLPYPLDLDGHISSAERLFEDHPPETLPFGAWKHVPSCSVLKTTRDPYHKYTVEEAEQLFKQQTRQLQNEERRQKALDFARKHRRAVGSVALAILVGAASIYIRRKGLDTSIWSYFGWLRGVFKG